MLLEIIVCFIVLEMIVFKYATLYRYDVAC